MIKYITYITVFLLLFSIKTFAQEDAILDSAAVKTCNYLKQKEIADLGIKDKKAKLGLFILTYYSNHKEEFVKAGLDFDITDSKSAGKFGSEVGAVMAAKCPDVILSLSNQMRDESKDKKEDVFYTKGKLKELSGTELASLSIRDKNNKIQKFILLSNFKGSEKLISGKFKKGTRVKIKYKNVEIYSPKLKEYIIKKEILEITYL